MQEWSIQKKILAVAAGIFAIITLGIFFFSWSDVNPGEEGFMYKPYGDGLEQDHVYTEGTYFVAPWNDMITYSTRQKSKSYQSKVMDKNGTDITTVVSVNYNATPNQTPKLHLKHGPGYVSFIDDKVKGAIKDVIGRYTYEEVYSIKREALEGEIEKILKEDFKGNYISLNYVEIADIDLPTPIANEIISKETQKQKNLTSFEKKIEEKNLADARFENARGDSSLVISATYKATAIKLESEQIAKNPAYIELIKWQGYASGKGSPFGTNNVFGDNALTIMKSSGK